MWIQERDMKRRWHGVEIFFTIFCLKYFQPYESSCFMQKHQIHKFFSIRDVPAKCVIIKLFHKLENLMFFSRSLSKHHIHANSLSLNDGLWWFLKRKNISFFYIFYVLYFILKIIMLATIMSFLYVEQVAMFNFFWCWNILYCYAINIHASTSTLYYYHGYQILI